MALKGGRKIVVRDKTFYWRVSGQGCSHFGGAPASPNVVIQEEAEKPGKAMVAYLASKNYKGWDAHDMDIGGHVHRASVTPKDVRLLVEKALDAGWDPANKKGTYQSSPDIDLTEYSTVAPGKPRT